jgi:hypothetical protein
MRETCTLCLTPFGNAGRYRGDGGTGIFEICEPCAQRIVDLRAQDPAGLAKLLDELLLAAARPQGRA